jgi:hypothetical protein
MWRAAIGPLDEIGRATSEERLQALHALQLAMAVWSVSAVNTRRTGSPQG